MRFYRRETPRPRKTWFFEVLASYFLALLTEVYQSSANSIHSNPLITGKNQLYGTALPCWTRLTHHHHRCLFHCNIPNSSIQMCPFYMKGFCKPLFFKEIRHPPAFPCRLQHSIIGRLSLNHRVRDGNGCYPQTHRHQNLFVSGY